LQELGRFNSLLDVMRSSLLELGQACRGLTLMSSELDELGKALFNGKVRPASHCILVILICLPSQA